MAGVTYQDYPHARLIVLWGVNPSASGIHLVPFVREAQKAGRTLVVIDPRATSLARQADLHLAVRPGTDLPVALALHRFLFEEGHADEAFLAEHTTGAERLRARAAEWTIERAADVAGIDAARSRAASPSCTSPPRRRWSAAAGASSATATAAAPRRRSWRCRRSPASSASAAAASR